MTGEPFQYSSGPRQAKIAIVGEAWGQEEEKVKRPFVGYSGQELTQMLKEAGLNRRDVFLTNVFAFRPKDNNIDYICGNRATVGKDYALPPIRQGKYILPEFLPEIERLKTELSHVAPNLIIAMGGTACWALLQNTRIGAIRGTVFASPWGKILPTYHPAAVLRNWSWRPIVLQDLMKAKREAEYREVRRPERWVLLDPTVGEIESWIKEHPRIIRLAVDIETCNRQISMIGIAPSPQEALVIPFIDPRFPGASYWPDIKTELHVWSLVERLLSHPCEKVFQNGLFDLQFLLKMGLKVTNCAHDTMLLHHSLFPELLKGLGFLGSIYSNEPAWKLMRTEKALKRDE